MRTALTGNQSGLIHSLDPHIRFTIKLVGHINLISPPRLLY